MPDRTSTKKDTNEIAHDVFLRSIGEEITQKNPAAVALGRLGGKKGGPARARKLSAKKRSSIAKSAALARWKKKEFNRSNRAIQLNSTFFQIS